MDTKEMLDLLTTHPLTQRMQAEKAAEVLRKREEAGAKIEALRQEAEERLPGLQAALDEVEAEFNMHDEARKGILDKLTTARAALTGERQRLERETSKAEALLLSNYDRAIDEGIQFFQDKREALLRKKPDSDTRAEGVNVHTLTKKLFAVQTLAR